MDELNQCDGCRRGLPVENGIHHGPTAWDIMRCTADRYRRAWMSNLPPLPEPSYAVNNVERRYFTADQLKAFAEEAVRLEREACAKAADDVDEPGWTGYECPNTFNDGKWAAAAAIRARSQEGRG